MDRIAPDDVAMRVQGVRDDLEKFRQRVAVDLERQCTSILEELHCLAIAAVRLEKPERVTHAIEHMGRDEVVTVARVMARTGASRHTVGTTLQRLLREGRIKRVARGQYRTKGAPKR